MLTSFYKKLLTVKKLTASSTFVFCQISLLEMTYNKKKPLHGAFQVYLNMWLKAVYVSSLIGVNLSITVMIKLNIPASAPIL